MITTAIGHINSQLKGLTRLLGRCLAFLLTVTPVIYDTLLKRNMAWPTPQSHIRQFSDLIRVQYLLLQYEDTFIGHWNPKL